MERTLFAPDITCDHCVATIGEAVDSIEGARFRSGNSQEKSFVIEAVSDAVVEQVSIATAAVGYPLDERPLAHDHDDIEIKMDLISRSTKENRSPVYKVSVTEKGAELSYSCPCGCRIGYTFDRSVADQQVEACCCGKQMFVAPIDAEDQLRSWLNEGEYHLDVQVVEMPWGQPMQVAIAIPVDEKQ